MNFFKKLLRGLFLILSFFNTASGQSPVKLPGNVKSVTIGDQSVNLVTDHAYLHIAVFSASVIRIRLDKQEFGKDHSYAVVNKPLKTRAVITQDNDAIRIQTDSLQVFITKKPLSVNFLDKKGSVINREEEGLYSSWVGEEVTSYRQMQVGEKFIGLGEKTGNLNRYGSGYTNWNTDAYGYSSNQDPIYSSIPFYIGIHHKLAYGIFLDNSFQTDFNFGASNNRFSSFSARDGELNYYFIHHSNVGEIIRSYTWLTGRMPMPPLWSLGYQQNRYSYYPDTEVLRIAQTLREKKIPADGITLDIHYMDRYQLFTWDKQRFPDPKAMTGQLKQMGFRTTVIVDPGIKIEPGAAAFERGLKQDAYIKYNDGKYYAGQVWPGWCYFPDFTSERGRSFWREEMKFFTNNGVSGIWNDMNEIATWGQKMPSNIIFDFEGRKASHLEAHNIYGSLMAKTSYDGAKAANNNERPFILTRAGFAGLQKYSAIWTGDNRSEEDHMLAGVRLLNSLGISGVPFTGMDIGGFTGNPTVGLYSRWIQLGAFFPYFRNHTGFNTKSSEPWTFGEDVTDIARNYISLRYRLLPYLYNNFYEATQTGMPVMRSLAIEHSFDDRVYEQTFQNEFMFGPSLLVLPVESDKNFMKAYLPAFKWYDIYSDKLFSPGETILELRKEILPVFVKESSIIPMQSLVQSTKDKPGDSLFLHIYKGGIKHDYEYYEDDGISYDYEKGSYYLRDITYDPANSLISFSARKGNGKSKFKKLILILHGFDQSAGFISKGISLKTTKGKYHMLEPEAGFKSSEIIQQNEITALGIELPWTDQEFEIRIR